MAILTTIGLDLAKNVFWAHGAAADGTVVFRKKLRRDQVLRFLAEQPHCTVAMETCPGAHHCGRLVQDLGHEVRLIAPAYVKPFVKRQKNDAADAEAIAEAATIPTMRFVPLKSEGKQAAMTIFRTRDVLVGQRTQLINALRGHLSEYGVIAPQGPSHVEREIAERAKRDDAARRLMTIPGIGPMIATALEALALAAESFACGRDFAAWIGLTPLQRSTGGKERLGRISNMGERTLRRLLVSGASGVVRWAKRKGAPEGSWLARMLQRKPPMVVIVALANRTARIAWALMAKGGVYRAPAVSA